MTATRAVSPMASSEMATPRQDISARTSGRMQATFMEAPPRDPDLTVRKVGDGEHA